MHCPVEVKFSEQSERRPTATAARAHLLCQPGISCMEISRCPNIIWSMDSPPNLETVYQAVCSLYNNTNPAEPGKASLWLGELQKSVSLSAIVCFTVLRKILILFIIFLFLSSHAHSVRFKYKRAGFLLPLPNRQREWACREANLKRGECVITG